MSDRVVRSKRAQRQEVIDRYIRRRATKTDLRDVSVWTLGAISYCVIGFAVANIAGAYAGEDPIHFGEPFDVIFAWTLLVCLIALVPMCIAYVWGRSAEDAAVRSLYKAQRLLAKPGVLRNAQKQRLINKNLRSVVRHILRLPGIKGNSSVAVVTAAQLKANHVRSIMDKVTLPIRNSRLDIRDQVIDDLFKIAKGRWQEIKDGDPNYIQPPSRWKKIALILIALALLCSIGLVALYVPEAAGFVGVVAIPIVLLIAKRLGFDPDIVGSGIKLGREGSSPESTSEEDA